MAEDSKMKIVQWPKFRILEDADGRLPLSKGPLSTPSRQEGKASGNGSCEVENS